MDSGRSTPEHLKKYSGSNGIAGDDDDDEDGENENRENEDNSSMNNKTKDKRGRTFSETLKLLDDDILAELDVS